MSRRVSATQVFGMVLLAGCAACSAPSSLDAAAVPDAPPDTTAPPGDADISPPDTAVPGTDSPLDLLTLDQGAAEAAGPGDALSARETDATNVPTCTSACNSVTPRNPTVDSNGGTGNVTMYTTQPTAGGACNYGTTGILYFAAVNVNISPGDGKGQWNGGRICGQCAEVTAFTSQGPKSVVVRITDRCADASCGMDLGGQAPTIMADGFGRYDGSWRFVTCTGHPEVSDGAPSLFVVTGSNAWWSRVQVRNPPWAVAAIDWRDPTGTAAGSFPFAADPENTYEVPAAVLQSTAAALRVTVTYTDGSTATARLEPSDLAAPGTSYPLNDRS